MSSKLIKNGLSRLFSDEFLGRLFGGLKMTWKRVIIFGVCRGVYTALMALLIPSNNSLKAPVGHINQKCGFPFSLPARSSLRFPRPVLKL